MRAINIHLHVHPYLSVIEIRRDCRIDREQLARDLMVNILQVESVSTQLEIIYFCN